jgi:hypothetical protein
MNPEAESANNEERTRQNRQKPPLITTNNPEAESANKEEQCYKTGRSRH